MYPFLLSSNASRNLAPHSLNPLFTYLLTLLIARWHSPAVSLPPISNEFWMDVDLCPVCLDGFFVQLYYIRPNMRMARTTFHTARTSLDSFIFSASIPMISLYSVARRNQLRWWFIQSQFIHLRNRQLSIETWILSCKLKRIKRRRRDWVRMPSVKFNGKANA